MDMQSMLLRLMFGQWLGLAKNRDYESTEELIRQLEAAVLTLEENDTRQTSQQKSEDGLSTKHRPPITGE